MIPELPHIFFAEVACERRGIAGDVHDFFGPVRNDRLQRFGMQPHPRRIDHDAVEFVLAAGLQLRVQHFFGAAFVETDVADAVAAGALQCVFNGRRMRFDADHPFTIMSVAKPFRCGGPSR